MLDSHTLSFVAKNLMARAQAERIMRDDARREGRDDIARLHGDRAQALIEAAAAVPYLSEAQEQELNSPLE